MTKSLGTILHQLRKDAGLSQKELSDGIVSISELSRVEYREKELDYILLESLFERLGKSLDKIELVLSKDEYHPLFLREEIKFALLQRDLCSASTLLQKYQKTVIPHNNIQKQYCSMIGCLIDYFENKNYVDCLKPLSQAISLTFPFWDNPTWGNVRLCIQELRILHMIAYIKIQTSYLDNAPSLLTNIERYLERYETDAEEKVKIYPQCELLLSKLFFKLGDTEKALNACQKGKNNLISNGSSTLIREFLSLELTYKKICHTSQNTEVCEHQIAALDFIYKITGYPHETDFLLLLLAQNTQWECIINHSIIRELRIARGYSQELLSGGICSQETLARIEAGHRNPNKRNCYQLMEKLGITRKKYYGFIISDDYQIYEDARLYNRLISLGRRQTAYNLLKRIEERLDLSLPVNKQFVETGHIQEKLWKKEISNDEAILSLTQLLRLTYPASQAKDLVYRIPFRQEFIILNQIAICHKKTGRYTQALDLYTQIMQRYKKGELPMQYHAIPGFILYINYTGILEETDSLKEAKSFGNEGLIHALKCGRGDVIGPLLANIACIYEKELLYDMENELLKSSFYMLSLYKRESDSLLIKKVYKNKYGIELSD